MGILYLFKNTSTFYTLYNNIIINLLIMEYLVFLLYIYPKISYINSVFINFLNILSDTIFYP